MTMIVLCLTSECSALAVPHSHRWQKNRNNQSQHDEINLSDNKPTHKHRIDIPKQNLYHRWSIPFCGIREEVIRYDPAAKTYGLVHHVDVIR